MNLGFRSILFLGGCLGFVLFFLHELDPWHKWPPWHYAQISESFGWVSLAIINVFLVTAIASGLALHRAGRDKWLSRGVFVAFMISVTTEMFGLPLLVYLLSPLVQLPVIGEGYRLAFGHLPITAGMAISLGGISLLVASWLTLHSAREDIVSSGIYRWVRHPQYAAIIAFTFGWLLHWPTIVTLGLWPFLVAIYLRLARREEAAMLRKYGAKYRQYVACTGRFFPRFSTVRVHQP